MTVYSDTYQTIPELLRAELAARQNVNSRYSLRSFGRALGINHTLLSLIISGRRNVTKSLIERVAKAMNLRPLVKQRFLSYHLSNGTPLEVFEKPTGYDEISLENFSVIADWYHFAILSLLETQDSKFEVRWISERLGVEQDKIKEAMKRLVDLKLVGMVNGRWKQVGQPLKLENQVSTVATRRFHGEHLKNALRSLEVDPFEIREHCGVTLALDPKLIPEAKEKIKSFRRSLARLLEKSGDCKEAYHLSIQLFPLSRAKK